MNGSHSRPPNQAARLEQLLARIVELDVNFESPQVGDLVATIGAVDTQFVEACRNTRQKYDLHNILNQVKLACLVLHRQSQLSCIDKSLPPALNRSAREAIRLLQMFQGGGR